MIFLKLEKPFGVFVRLIFLTLVTAVSYLDSFQNLFKNFQYDLKPAQKQIYFKAEQSGFCSPSTVLLKPSKNSTVTTNHQNLIFIGAFDLTENINNPLVLHVKTDKCSPQTLKCREHDYTKIPGVCAFFNQIPFQKGGLGDYTKPPMRCPIKKGRYDFDINWSLEKFGNLPIDASSKYQIKIMLYEMMADERKRMVTCFYGNIRIMESSSRPKAG